MSSLRSSAAAAVTDFSILTRRLREFRHERGWEEAHTPANLAMSVAIEAGELLECFQWGQMRLGVEEEMADVAIYLLNLADVLDIDLMEAILAKIDANSKRFPAVRV